MKKAFQIITALLLTAALAASAGASSFTPSVEQKGAPDAAVVGSDKQIITIPFSEEKTSETIKAALEEAYESIASAESLAEAAPALADALKTLAPELTADALVVRDLLYVGIPDLVLGETVVVNFDLKLEEGALLIPILFIDGEWVPVASQLTDSESDAPKLVAIHEDGSVDIAFTAGENLIAFVTAKTV